MVHPDYFAKISSACDDYYVFFLEMIREKLEDKYNILLDGGESLDESLVIFRIDWTPPHYLSTKVGIYIKFPRDRLMYYVIEGALEQMWYLLN